MERLNEIWLGSFKLRVFLPKYERSQWDRDVIKPKPYLFNAQSGIRLTNKSYKDITAPKPIMVDSKEDKQGGDLKMRQGGSHEGETHITFEPKEEEYSWLSKCWVGILKPDFTWEEDGEELQS